ncbi:MAG: choice-of-anchor tandem repeat GloVer-containing protein [Candidatus Korobacteraceae bacterium]
MAHATGNTSKLAAIALASFVLSVVLMSSAAAQTFTVLHNFTNGADGRDPFAGLSMDRAGNLYGTAARGGLTNCDGGNGCGVVFKLSNHNGGWTFSTLLEFNGTDGLSPQARVIVGPDGNLYGTTVNGGTNGEDCVELASGCGVVFKLTPPPNICRSTTCPWNETVLYNFSGDDGAFPYNEVVFDEAGNLYGTTEMGGTSGLCNPYGIFGCGNVFKLSPAQGWMENILYEFQSNGTDGVEPMSNLIFDAVGNLYGATVNGGTTGGGTIFELSSSGGSWNESVLFGQFTLSNSTGEQPWGGVIFDPQGNLYGTTSYGSYYGDTAGTIFKMTPGSGSWSYDVLYTIPSIDPQIGGPVASLTSDAAGNLYGTTRTGGVNGDGQVFKITPDGTFTSLHDFLGGSDGCEPQSNVVIDSHGNLYGTATFCGEARNNCSIGCGTVWEITP